MAEQRPTRIDFNNGSSITFFDTGEKRRGLEIEDDGQWPFGPAEPSIMDGIGEVRPDAFDEPGAESKAVWERNARPIIEQIARVRAEG